MSFYKLRGEDGPGGHGGGGESWHVDINLGCVFT